MILEDPDTKVHIVGRLISGAMTQFKGDTISHCHLGGERVVSQLYLKNPSLTKGLDSILLTT